MMPASPEVARRRLAAELRAIRVARNRSGDRVAAALGWGASKISRWELAKVTPKPADLAELLDFYQVTGSRRDLLLGLAEAAARKGWWERDGDAIAACDQQVIGLEQSAAAIAIWHLEAVPGLLQTEAYARQLITGRGQLEPVPPGLIERQVRARLRRQQILHRDPPPQLSVVLCESVLHRRIGDATVMGDQLRRLAADATRPNITVRILPLDTPHVLLSGCFAIFTFGPAGTAMPDVVSAGHLTGGQHIDGERDAYLHQLAFTALAAAALDPAESAALIARTAQSRWHTRPATGEPRHSRSRRQSRAR